MYEEYNLNQSISGMLLLMQNAKEIVVKSNV